jgi:SAM-dependent methyltransferase
MEKNRIKYYQKKIDELGDWYQPIEFIKDELKTRSKYDYGSTLHGMNKWNFILRKNLPKKMEGKKILDIGCASGLYSMLCVKEGAKVIGVELDEEGYKQSLLTREIFSELDGRDYSKNFEILHMDLMNFDWDKYGVFDVVMALNVLYWIKIPYIKISEKDQKNYNSENLTCLIKKIKNHSRVFLVQSDENKYWVRKRKNSSLEATNSKKVVELLRSCGYRKISIDKPIAPLSIWRTIIKRTAEIELRTPIFYARPIIKAEN